MPKRKFYVVWKGRQTGLGTKWEACYAAVSGFPRAIYRAFDSRQEAQAAFRIGPKSSQVRRGGTQQRLFAASRPSLPSICTDAACNGSPGMLEYRAVDTETGRELFHAGPYPDGTNNVGEFLALVRGMRWVGTAHSAAAVYSDSEIAIGWVRSGKCRTGLARTGRNDALFALIAQAERWLADKSRSGATPVLKWDTSAWGENRADFGRK